jgi:adenylylsulfate reductase subunit A
VDSRRQTTIRGLFAAGDVAGGCPQKYASGAMAEAEIAVLAALDYAAAHPLPAADARGEAPHPALAEALAWLRRPRALFSAEQLEEGMQQTMDSYAGGISAQYRYNGSQLARAEARIGELFLLSGGLRAADMRGLLRIHELRERLVLCRSLIAHLGARKESRWPGFGEHAEYPGTDDAWLLHVNSRLQGGEIRVFFRALVGKDEEYEHAD